MTYRKSSSKNKVTAKIDKDSIWGFYDGFHIYTSINKLYVPLKEIDKDYVVFSRPKIGEIDNQSLILLSSFVQLPMIFIGGIPEDEMEEEVPLKLSYQNGIFEDFNNDVPRSAIRYLYVFHSMFSSNINLNLYLNDSLVGILPNASYSFVSIPKTAKTIKVCVQAEGVAKVCNDVIVEGETSIYLEAKVKKSVPLTLQQPKRAKDIKTLKVDVEKGLYELIGYY